MTATALGGSRADAAGATLLRSYFDGNDWAIGPEDLVGGDACCACVEDSAKIPTAIRHTWQLFGGDDWIDAPAGFAVSPAS